MKHIAKTFALFCIGISLLAGTGCKTKKAGIKNKGDRETQMARDKAEQDRKRAEEERNRMDAEQKAKDMQKQQEIEDAFSQLASSATSNSDANRIINSVLAYFASPQTPVLIIINKSGKFMDYDKPTTIKLYLEYLKDTKKNMNNIYQVVKDENGKIKELSLIKK